MSTIYRLIEYRSISSWWITAWHVVTGGPPDRVRDEAEIVHSMGTGKRVACSPVSSAIGCLVNGHLVPGGIIHIARVFKEKPVVDVYERDIVCKVDAYWERCYCVPGCSAVMGHVKIRSPGANCFGENRD